MNFHRASGAVSQQALAANGEKASALTRESSGFIYGECQTVGAVIYTTKQPDPFPDVFGFYEIWHLFVMAGSFSHYWAILTYLSHTNRSQRAS